MPNQRREPGEDLVLMARLARAMTTAPLSDDFSNTYKHYNTPFNLAVVHRA